MGPAATEDHALRRGGRRLTRRATHRRRCPGRRRSGATVHAGPRAPSGPAAGIGVLNGRCGRRRLRQGQQPPLPRGGVPGARRTTPSVGAFDRRRIPERADPPACADVASQRTTKAATRPLSTQAHAHRLSYT